MATKSNSADLSRQWFTNIEGYRARGGQTGVRAEVLPVDRERVAEVFPRAHLGRRGGPTDLEQLYQDLLLGRRKLWVAVRTDGQEPDEMWGVIVTRVSALPPSERHMFRYGRGPEELRTLTVQIFSNKWVHLTAWIDNAVERITAYGMENGCRQLFVLARVGLRHYLLSRFFASAPWDTVAWARDRDTLKGCTSRKLYARPMLFRRVIQSAWPVEHKARYQGAQVTYC